MKEIYNKIISIPVLRMVFSISIFSTLWVLMCLLVNKEPSLLTMFYVGLLSGIFGTSLLDKNLSMKEKVCEIAESLYGNNFYIPKIMAGAWLIYWFNKSMVMPVELFVYEARNLFLSLSMMAFLFILIKQTVFFVTDGIKSIHNVLKHTMITVFKAILATSGILWFIGSFGDDLYRFIIQNTEDSLVILTAVIMLMIFVSFVGANYSSVSSCKKGTCVISKKAKEKITFNENEKWIASFRKAGCAAFYAAIDKLPSTIEIRLFNDMSKDICNYTAEVEGIFNIGDKKKYEWLMLMLMTGKESEQIFNLEQSMDLRTNMIKWQELAHEYLSFYSMELTGEYYYINPRSQFEEQNNNKMLAKLQKEQELLVYDFIVNNKVVILDMAAQLNLTSIISNNDLKAYLSRIVLPVNITKIKAN